MLLFVPFTHDAGVRPSEEKKIQSPTCVRKPTSESMRIDPASLKHNYKARRDAVESGGARE